MSGARLGLSKSPGPSGASAQGSDFVLETRRPGATTTRSEFLPLRLGVGAAAPRSGGLQTVALPNAGFASAGAGVAATGAGVAAAGVEGSVGLTSLQLHGV